MFTTPIYVNNKRHNKVITSLITRANITVHLLQTINWLVKTVN